MSQYDFEFQPADSPTLPDGWSWVNQGPYVYRETDAGPWYVRAGRFVRWLPGRIRRCVSL